MNNKQIGQGIVSILVQRDSTTQDSSITFPQVFKTND